MLSLVAITVILLVGMKVRTVKRHNDFIKAKKMYGQGEVTQSLPVFEEVYDRLKTKDIGGESLIYLIQGNNATGNYEKSIFYADELLAAGQGDYADSLALYWMGDSYGKKNEYGKAVQCLNTLISKYGTSEYVDDALFQLARLRKDENQYLQARHLLKLIKDNYPNSNLIREAINMYGDLNAAILFSPIIDEHSTIYVVKPGDSLASIAKKYNSSVDLLKKSNGLNNKSVIKPNDRLKVNKAVFSMIIDKSKNTLTLLADGELFKVYNVGTGKMNSTPCGNFNVTNKLANPPWYKPGGGLIPFGTKENFLGTRWIGISSPGYGIHGTWEPQTVGKQSSAGCVRLINDDVEELFSIVVPDDKVIIVD